MAALSIEFSRYSRGEACREPEGTPNQQTYHRKADFIDSERGGLEEIRSRHCYDLWSRIEAVQLPSRKDPKEPCWPRFLLAAYR